MSVAPTAFRVAEDRQEKFRTALGETSASQPDTDTACALFVQLYLGVCAIMGADNIPLSASVRVATENLAILSIGQIPLLSLVMCTRMRQARELDTIREIRCCFTDSVTRQQLDAGLVEIEFWRKSASPDRRQQIAYIPPPVQVELAATPLWDADDLHLGGAEYATDRANLLLVMKLVRNAHAVMPIGIETSIDLLYAHDFQSARGKRKRLEVDERAQRKHRNGATTSADGVVSTHIGYCVLFQHSYALPSINDAFMRYLVDKVGPTVMNWLVLFADTREIHNSTNVKRRNEVLAIIVRRSDTPEDQVVPFTISGTQWLVRRIDHAKKNDQ